MHLVQVIEIVRAILIFVVQRIPTQGFNFSIVTTTSQHHLSMPVSQASPSLLQRIPEKEIKRLHRKGLVSLEEPTLQKEDFSSFLAPKKSRWFWIVISITLLSFGSILSIPETGTPLSYVRYIFAFILVAFLPGYCLNETLFPKEGAMDEIERVTFSIGLSFAVTALVAFFLSFTPFGLTLATALPTLGTVVIILAIIALIRKYEAQ